MSGIGYRHPSFSHGTWHGELAVHGERVRTDDLDPLDVTNIHVQHLCRARYGGRDGVGVMEQLVVRPLPGRRHAQPPGRRRSLRLIAGPCRRSGSCYGWRPAKPSSLSCVDAPSSTGTSAPKRPESRRNAGGKFFRPV